MRAAQHEFDKWYGWAIRSRLEPIKRTACMMKKYLYGILGFARHRFTNARTEGMNSKIQLLKHRARGYRNRENFRTAILFHCGGLNMDHAKPGRACFFPPHLSWPPWSTCPSPSPRDSAPRGEIWRAQPGRRSVCSRPSRSRRRSIRA